MSLLRAEAIERARKAIAVRGERRRDVMRQARFGQDGSGVPAGYVQLRSKEDQALWLRHLQVEAMREQQGFAEGQAATEAVAHPAVRQEIAGDVRATGADDA